jgi:hypothetical protein
VTVREYATPLAFKQALEQRLRSASATGTDFARRRQLLVFDRFLARVAVEVTARLGPGQQQQARQLEMKTLVSRTILTASLGRARPSPAH